MNGVKRFFATNQTPVDCDLEKRILRACVFATTGLASDGWIVLPGGMALERFNRQPLVTSRHVQLPEGAVADGEAIAIARALNLTVSDFELTAEVQFADTELGREYAFLFGINPERIPYMRSWSIEGPVLDKRALTWPEARTLSAQYWDETLAERMRGRCARPMVATRYELSNVAAVALGADRNALTRAAGLGNNAAQDWLARLDLETSSTELEELKRELSETSARLARLEREHKALVGEVASAARQRNAEAVLAEIRELNQRLTGRE